MRTRIWPARPDRFIPTVQIAQCDVGQLSIRDSGAVGFSCRMLSLAADAWSAYPSWLNPGDNAWQMTAATFVGLMSVPGLVVLYGGVMQKRWSVNAMMMSFIAFALVLLCWVLWGFKMGFGSPVHISGHGILANLIGKPGSILGSATEQQQAVIPLITTGPPFHFPTATLAYFQFVFAAIT